MLKNSTSVLILDNGEPSFVILGYDSYKTLLSDQEKEVKINRSSFEVGSQRVKQLSPKDSRNGISTGSNMGTGEGSFQHHISAREAELIEKINKEISSLKNEIEKEEKDTG